jgi:hypothetical protein
VIKLTSAAAEKSTTLPRINTYERGLQEKQRQPRVWLRESRVLQSERSPKEVNLMALVLSIGADPSLMRTRQLLLEKAGHSVVGVMDEKKLAEVCEANEFEVVVVSQTISPPMKKRIMSLVRGHCPTTKVLELYTVASGRTLEDADSWIEVPAETPQELAERVTAMAKPLNKS